MFIGCKFWGHVSSVRQLLLTVKFHNIVIDCRWKLLDFFVSLQSARGKQDHAPRVQQDAQARGEWFVGVLSDINLLNRAT